MDALAEAAPNGTRAILSGMDRTGGNVQLPDEQLVQRTRNGDRRAFEDLVERYKQKAYHIAFDFTRDREEAKDLSQEAFLKAYTNIKNFDGRSGFYTWFYRILVNLCLDFKRKNSRRPTAEFDETSEHAIEPSHHTSRPAAPDKQVFAGQIARKVEAALAALPPKQRTAFVLKNHQGLSIKEIAATMEAAEGTVKVHLHRAVSSLRASLADLL